MSVSLTNCEQTVLAVNKLKLTAVANQDKQQIPLQWTVSDDQAVRFYEVQRSADGIHFSSLQTVNASQSSIQKTYQYMDEFPVNGDNYYRIKEVDVNGIIAYSNIVRSAIKIFNEVTIAPNPASAFITISAKTTIKQIQLFSSKAQLLLTVSPQSNNYKLQINNLSSGNYFLRIQTEDGIVNRKFIKQ